MGSHSFTETVPDPRPIDVVYRELVEAATYEYGHDGYNGTISTTAGVHVVSGLVTLEEAIRIEQARIERLHKWEACEAVPYSQPAEHEYGEPYDVDVDVTLPVGTDDDTLKAAVAKAAHVKADEVDSTWGLRRTYSAKVKVQTTAGARNTRYFIVATGHFPDRADAGFVSQAEARAALMAGHGISAYRPAAEVIAVTRRGGGEGLVRGTATVGKIRYAGTATIRPIIKRGLPNVTKQAGWHIYGWAAS